MYTHTHTYVYDYIDVSTCVYIYIYIYTYLIRESELRSPVESELFGSELIRESELGLRY